MAQALLWSGLLVASLAGAAALVFAIVRATEHGTESARAEWRGREARRRPPRREPAWWPEFERAFSDYVRAGYGRRS